MGQILYLPIAGVQARALAENGCSIATVAPDIEIRGVVVRQVEPVTGQQHRLPGPDPAMHALAVEFDLMRPGVAGRDLRHKFAQLRLDPGRRRGELPQSHPWRPREPNASQYP